MQEKFLQGMARKAQSSAGNNSPSDSGSDDDTTSYEGKSTSDSGGASCCSSASDDDDLAASGEVSMTAFEAEEKMVSLFLPPQHAEFASAEASALTETLNEIEEEFMSNAKVAAPNTAEADEYPCPYGEYEYECE